MAEKLRIELENRKKESEKTRENTQLFVEECFSLEMKDNAWWID